MCCLSFETQHAEMGKTKQMYRILFSLWTNSAALAYTMPCITIDWNQSASLYQRWNDLTWGSIDCSMHGIVYPKGADFFQSANRNPVLFFFFFAVAIQPTCHVSSERKQFVNQIHTVLVLVEFYLESYDRINLLVSYFFCTLLYI